MQRHLLFLLLNYGRSVHELSSKWLNSKVLFLWDSSKLINVLNVEIGAVQIEKGKAKDSLPRLLRVLAFVCPLYGYVRIRMRICVGFIRDATVSYASSFNVSMGFVDNASLFVSPEPGVDFFII